MAQVERVLNLLYNVGEHHDPRAAAVAVSHVSSGPAAEAIDHLACGTGPAQSIREGMAQRIHAIFIAAPAVSTGLTVDRSGLPR